jgi:antibiotic biosynthesis monooxygenase (ABM) superfamily enzyme
LQEMDGSDAGRQEILHANTTFWFGVSPEKNRKKWKQVAVSFLAVYPLTQVVPGLVQLVLNELEIESVLLSGMLNGMIISSCMVYLCMPLALEFFKRWLNS